MVGVTETEREREKKKKTDAGNGQWRHITQLLLKVIHSVKKKYIYISIYSSSIWERSNKIPTTLDSTLTMFQ